MGDRQRALGAQAENLSMCRDVAARPNAPSIAPRSRPVRLPALDLFAREVAQGRERHIVRALPRLGHWRKSLPLAFALPLKAKPSTLERYSRKARRGLSSAIVLASPVGRIRSSSSATVGNVSPSLGASVGLRRVRLPNLPAPPQIIIEDAEPRAIILGQAVPHDLDAQAKFVPLPRPQSSQTLTRRLD